MARLYTYLLVFGLSFGLSCAEVAAKFLDRFGDMPPQATQVVVVGAGLAGLVTAYELQKRGIETHIFEASAFPGGRVSTADYGAGLTAEYGMQEIWAGNPLIEIATELGVALELEYQHCAHSTFLYDGEIYPDIYDGTMRAHFESFLDPEQSRALQDWLDTAKLLHGIARREGLGNARVRVLQDQSFQRWVSSSEELPGIARHWLRLHMEAELGSDWTRFSALFALLEMDILFDGGAACFSPDGGNSRVTDALAKASGPVTLSARVTGIRESGDNGVDGPVRVSYQQNHRVESIAADYVVLAVPHYRLHQIAAEPPLSDAHWQAINSLGMGQYVVVHLIMDKDKTILTTSKGIELPDVLLTNGPLGYAYGEVGANAENAVFSMLIYGDHARTFHMVPKDVKIRELLASLDRIQPGFSDGVVDAHVYTYHPGAIPVWAPGRSPLDEQSALLRAPFGKVYLAGDYIEGAHSTSAVKRGIDVARLIAADLADAGD